MIRVVIADDHGVIRDGLGRLIGALEDMEVVGLAVDGAEAVTRCQETHPDVVLMDLEMPVVDGYESTRQIKARCPGIWVIALTLHGYAAARDRAAQAGTDDFIEKGAPLQALVQSIQRCAETSIHTGDRQ